MREATNVWKIFTLTLFVLLVFSLFTLFSKGFSFTGITGSTTSENELSVNEIQGKMETFLLALVPPDVGTASITNIVEESGIYKVSIASTVSGNTENSVLFVTKDGKILFLQGIDLDNSIDSLYKNQKQ